MTPSEAHKRIDKFVQEAKKHYPHSSSDAITNKLLAHIQFHGQRNPLAKRILVKALIQRIHAQLA